MSMDVPPLYVHVQVNQFPLVPPGTVDALLPGAILLALQLDNRRPLHGVPLADDVECPPTN